MSYRILHLADLHLDTSFAGTGLSPAVARLRRSGLREALRRVVDIAIEKRVDAVTIAGDLYERDRLSRDTARLVRDELGRLAPIPVLIAPGNHDPVLAGSPYAADSWPANVHLFREPSLQPCELPNGPVVWGAGHNAPNLVLDLVAGLESARQTSEVVLLHATDRACTLDSGKGAHCPFSRDMAASKGPGLFLLGHIHSYMESRTGSSVFCYPGCTEPLAMNDFGEHGAVIAEFDQDSWNLQPLPIARWRCTKSDLDISECGSRSDVADLIKTIFPESNECGTHLARIRLQGTPPESLDLDLPAIVSDCSGRFASLLLEDQTSLAYDLETIANEPTTKGRFVQKLLELRGLAGEGERLRIDKALEFGLKALEGKEVSAQCE